MVALQRSITMSNHIKKQQKTTQNNRKTTYYCHRRLDSQPYLALYPRQSVSAPLHDVRTSQVVWTSRNIVWRLSRPHTAGTARARRCRLSLTSRRVRRWGRRLLARIRRDTPPCLDDVRSMMEEYGAGWVEWREFEGVEARWWLLKEKNVRII